jgi:hypothetical protein
MISLRKLTGIVIREYLIDIALIGQSLTIAYMIAWLFLAGWLQVRFLP